MKTICISGSTGFIGSYLVKELQKDFYNIKSIGKNHLMEGDVHKASESIDGTFAVINLAGYPISRRWSEKNKERIRKSRILSTKTIVKAIALCKNKPLYLINASGTDIYPKGKMCSEICFEEDDGFLAEVIKEWEAAAKEASEYLNVIIARFGIVLGKNGGVYRIFENFVRHGIGLYFGNGKQNMPVVHIDELVEVIKYFLRNENLSGVYNIVEPFNVSQKEFIEKLCLAYNKKFLFSVNKLLIKILMGEQSGLLIDDRKIIPEKLIMEGYSFKFHNINEVVNSLTN